MWIAKFLDLWSDTCHWWHLLQSAFHALLPSENQIYPIRPAARWLMIRMQLSFENICAVYLVAKSGNLVGVWSKLTNFGNRMFANWKVPMISRQCSRPRLMASVVHLYPRHRSVPYLTPQPRAVMHQWDRREIASSESSRRKKLVEECRFGKVNRPGRKIWHDGVNWLVVFDKFYGIGVIGL